MNSIKRTTMKNLGTSLMIFLAVMMITETAFSQKISIQGILKDGDGAAVTDDSYDLTFTLYNDLSAGNQVWTETQTGIQVRGGIYSVMLGKATSLNGVLFDVPYFLGVKVNAGTELTPRTELSYAPYALSVENSETSTLASKASTLASGGGNGAAMQFTFNDPGGQPTYFWGGNAHNDQRVYNRNNINVGSATTAGLSNTLRQNGNGGAMTFHWSGQPGQPIWLWGGNDGVNHYVYDPSNFSVNYANTAGSAPANGGHATSAGSAGGLTGIPNIQVASVRIDGQPVWPAGTYGAGGPFRYMDLNGVNYSSAAPGQPVITTYSLVSVGRLAAGAFDAYSDRRIKTNILMSSPASDLSRLNSLEVVDYQYIDKTTEGYKTKKGFIAQQVASVFPEAVSYMQKKIPDVYSFAKSIEHIGPESLITMEMEHSLKVGDKISLVSESKEELFVIKDCPTLNQFIVEGLDTSEDKIFVYGREVDDFHTIDDSMIFSLGISAIQQLVKQVSALEEENGSLRNQQEDQSENIAQLSDRLQALERRLLIKDQSTKVTSED